MSPPIVSFGLSSQEEGTKGLNQALQALQCMHNEVWSMIQAAYTGARESTDSEHSITPGDYG